MSHLSNNMPIFCEDISRFRQLLSDYPTDDYLANHSLKTLLNNYLSFYQINFLEQCISNRYSIWKSDTQTGHTIVQQYWGVDQPKGLAIIVHGYFDHTGLYGSLIQHFLQQQYDVLCFDLPGHGLSTGERGLIHHFDEYSCVLDTLLQQPFLQTLHPDKDHSLILAGQSTGCSIIANYLLHNSLSNTHLPVKHCIFLAPLVRIRGWNYLRWLLPIINTLTDNVPRMFKRSSHNPSFLDFVKDKDPLQTRQVPLAWLKAMDLWVGYLNHLIPINNKTCDTPLTIIQGTGDHTVDWRYNIPALQRHFANNRCHYIDHANHHLINESPQYWNAIVPIIKKAIASNSDLTDS